MDVNKMIVGVASRIKAYKYGYFCVKTSDNCGCTRVLQKNFSKKYIPS